MKSIYYKPITRYYYDDETETMKLGKFIASGNFADGHLAYTRLNEQGEEISGEETCYYQVKISGRLIMMHI